MFPGGGLSGFQQQPSLLDLMTQQQLGLSLALQQMQLAGQVQAAQQQRAAAAALQQQSVNAAAAASMSRRKEKEQTDQPEELFAKPEFKRMAEESDEETSARQLKLAKKLKDDADWAQAEGDRVSAARMRSRVGQRLTDIVDKYPKTPAAKQAESLLESLYR
jgi:hypothetical protein